jgi:predicted amidohydrolase
MAKINATPFRLALCQLGGTGPLKSHNIDLARRAVAQAAASTPKPHLIVLPEIWNSPYAVTSFREYSERVPNVGSTGAEAGGEGEGETVRAMREMAREAGCWLIGGEPEAKRNDHIVLCPSAGRGRQIVTVVITLG